MSLRPAASAIRPTDVPGIIEWAESEIVFREPYPAMLPGPFDLSLTPFWREPMEAVADPAIREVWVIKNSQSGCSECCLLMPMRYAVDVDPKTVVYVGGEMKGTREFMRERIKPGLQLSRGLRRKWSLAEITEHTIYYPDMMLICGWARATGIFKQRPVDLMLCDEVSTWPSFSSDKARKRLETRPFPCLVGVSALDAKTNRPTNDDPIWIEVENTDKRKYFLPDPGRRGRWFTFEMGFKDKKSARGMKYGLKWSEEARMADGTWDLDLVKKTAHYVTPSGAELWDKDKRDILQLGKWRPTKKCTDSTKRGYHINAFYMPWISFGDIAKAFLQHVARGKDSLRVFIYEWLAEEFWGELETVKSDVMSERQGEYEKGERMTESEGICNENGDTFKEFYVGRPSRVIVTVDVQKGYGWWLAREWVKGGDSGLIDYGKWMDWGELNDTATAAKASWVLVDCGYAERQQEVYEASLKYRFIPTKGQENIKDLLFLESAINPFEGKRRHRERHSLTVLFFKTDPFKMQLMQRIRAESGHAWYTYRDPEVDYQNQVTSEHREDGRWKIKPGHGTENHLWDCETLQLLGATRFGLNRFRGYENAEEGETVQSA